jgi:hypothetical protein
MRPYEFDARARHKGVSDALPLFDAKSALPLYVDSFLRDRLMHSRQLTYLDKFQCLLQVVSRIEANKSMRVAALRRRLCCCFSIITKPLGKNVVDRNVVPGVKVSQFLVIVGSQTCTSGHLSLGGNRLRLQIFRHSGDSIKQVQDKTTTLTFDLKEALALRSQ